MFFVAPYLSFTISGWLVNHLSNPIRQVLFLNNNLGTSPHWDVQHRDKPHLPGNGLDGCHSWECMFIKPLLIGIFELPAISMVIASEIIVTKSLLFKMGRDYYFCPVTAAASIGTKEIPCDRIFIICAWKVLNLLFRRWLWFWKDTARV